MSVPESRAERLAAAAVEADLDSVIVGDLVRPGDSGRDQMADIAWLTGFGGSSGLAVIGPEVRAFVTDFRYTTRAAETVPGSFEVVDATADMLAAVAGLLSGRVGIVAAKTSLESHRKLGEKLGEGVEIVAGDDLVTDLRELVTADTGLVRVADISYDEWSGEPVRQRLERRTGVPMYPVAQTYKGMTHGMTELMALTKSRGWSHHGNPVAEFCFDSVEVRHPPGEPDLIRLAPVPMYCSFEDVVRAVDALARTA